MDDHGLNGGRVMVNGANKDVTPRRVPSSSSLPASAAAAINYPDSQQVFVGNLPQHLTDQDLIEFFERKLSSPSLVSGHCFLVMCHLFHQFYIVAPRRTIRQLYHGT